MSETAVVVDLVLPQLGETVTEGTIVRWFKKPGERVELGELIYEISTEKVDSEVPSPMAGVVVELLVAEGETVDVGMPLAKIELDPGVEPPDVNAFAPLAPAAEPPAEPPVEPPVEAGAAPPAATSAGPSPGPSAGPLPGPQPTSGLSLRQEPSQLPLASATPEPPDDDGLMLVSPLVRRLMRENGLTSQQVTGTGPGGRITRADVLDAIDQMRQGGRPAAAAVVASAPGATVTPVVASPGQWDSSGTQFEPFTNIRRRTAQAMVLSAATSAHVLTVMEVDYEAVDRARRRHREQFKADEGFSLTFLPFVVVATAAALAAWPRINASIDEVDGTSGLRMHRDRNIGVAVDMDHQGLIVPVLRKASGLSLRGAARAIDDLATRARTKQLRPDDVAGGTFTISNNGSFGTYTTAAIINQPQVAVLSTDGVARRPVVVTDAQGAEAIAVHSVGHLCLSWDHRAFDGAYAASFLGHIKQALEGHNWTDEL